MKSDLHILNILCLCVAILPVQAVSCTVPEAVPTLSSTLACSSFTFRAGTSSVSNAISKADSIDVFIFNDDKMARLDAYCRIENPPTRINAQGNWTQSYATVHSTSGRKTAVFLANRRSEELGIRDIMSYESICSVMQDIALEDPQKPVLSGKVKFQAGESVKVEMLPLLARIEVKSLNFDFSSRPYSEARTGKVKLYLTNVSSLHPIVEQDSVSVTSIINQGRLDSVQCAGLAHPEMLWSGTADGAVLYCYPTAGTYMEPETPDTSRQSSPNGATRLVVETEIDGNVWYYPIDVCSRGVRSGRSYSFEILITRTGSTDPDIPVESGTVIVKTVEEEWTEYENEIVDY